MEQVVAAVEGLGRGSMVVRRLVRKLFELDRKGRDGHEEAVRGRVELGAAYRKARVRRGWRSGKAGIHRRGGRKRRCVSSMSS